MKNLLFLISLAILTNPLFPAAYSQTCREIVRRAGWMSEDSGQYIRKPDPRNLRLNLRKGKPEIVDEYKLEIVFSGLNNKGLAELNINYSQRRDYGGVKWNPGATGFSPNPANYPDLTSSDLLAYVRNVYRTHRLCTGELQSELDNVKEILEITGYRNYTGSNRFYEHCVLDGTFDCYYDEHCDYGLVLFAVNETKNAYEFSIKLVSADSNSAEIEISYIGRGRYEPPEISGEK